jgi:lactate permease
MICTGISVCIIYGGRKTLIRGIPYIAAVSLVMGLVLYILASLGMASVIGLLTGLSGLLTVFVIYKLTERKKYKEKFVPYKSNLTLLQSVLPYALIVILSLAFFIIDPKWKISLNYPGYETLLGKVIDAEQGYVNFNLLKFPFTIIMLSSLITIFVYKCKNTMPANIIKKVVKSTAKKCVKTSITIALLLVMAVVMMDSGMIDCIASSLVSITGEVYPLVSPFIGMLGAFVTGSNTNSNIIFGSLQEIAASSLSLSPAVMCAVQSIGASVGGAIGPTTTSLGAVAAQINGKEGAIYKKTLMPILITVLVLGIANFGSSLLFG